MKKSLTITVLIILLTTAYAPLLVQAPPPVPMTVTGYVFIHKLTGENVTAPPGIHVYAKWNTTIVNMEESLTGEDGNYTVGISGPPPPEGAPIDMWVETYNVTRITLEYMVILELNLTIPETAAIPTADFYAEPTSGNEPLMVHFYDNSTNFDTVTSWTWNFGDENITTTINANTTHTYIQNGTYTVSLTVNGTKNEENVTDTETKLDYIVVYDTDPTADFYATPTSGLKPLTVSFYDNSTSYDNITSWAWDFGDGNTSSEQNPTHNYTTAGIYTVNLTIIEPDGDNNTCTKQNYIAVEPVPPTITITNPTTENPVYTKAGQTITINFTYTAENPTNITLKIYNSATIGETAIGGLQTGTDIEGSADITLSSSAPDGKYHIEATIYTLEGLNGTDTETEAVIIDSTPPTITDVSQNPPKENVQPTDTVKVNATVTDQLSEIKNVTLLYSTDDGETWTPIQMELTGEVYSGTIPAFPDGTTVQYYIEAVDEAGNKATNPETTYYIYSVIPEFTSGLAILLILLAFTATIAVKRKQKRLR